MHVQLIFFRADASNLSRDQLALPGRRLLYQWLAVHRGTTRLLLRELSPLIREVRRCTAGRNGRFESTLPQVLPGTSGSRAGDLAALGWRCARAKSPVGICG